METMNSKQRFITALERGIPDRLPVTTHHLQDYFRETYMDGKSDIEIFEHFGMDPIHWTGPYLPNTAHGDYFDPQQEEPSNPRFSRCIVSENWQISSEILPDLEYEDDSLHHHHAHRKADHGAAAQ